MINMPRFCLSGTGKRDILIVCFIFFTIQARKDLSKEYGSSYQADEKVKFPWANIQKLAENRNKQETWVALLILLQGHRPIKERREVVND